MAIVHLENLNWILLLVITISDNRKFELKIIICNINCQLCPLKKFELNIITCNNNPRE